MCVHHPTVSDLYMFFYLLSLQSYVDGELKPRFNSEPVPKPEKGALIRKVVGSTFQQEVGNVKK